jgi:hypothetical protein
LAIIASRTKNGAPKGRNKVRIAHLAIIAVAVVLGACTQAPVRNVSQTPVVTGTGKPVTAEQVRSAIVRAGSGLGWQMTPVDPGLVSGRLALRGHVAVVDVRYSPKDFSITYKDSTGLDYANGQIHKNYNGWVENLDRDIRANLLSL